MKLTFRVPGIPRARGSKRPLPTRSGRIVLADMSKDSGAWMASIAFHARQVIGPEEPTRDAVVTNLVFCYERPADHYGTGKNRDRLRPNAPQYHLHSPDLDKLCRAVLDALTGIVWHDDRQIVKLIATRDYARGTGPGVEIEVLSLP